MELLVVVVMIGILAAVAVPQYHKAVEKSRVAEAKIMLKHLMTAAQLSLLEGKEIGSLKNLDIDFTIDNQVDYLNNGGGNIITKNFAYGYNEYNDVGCIDLGGYNFAKGYVIGYSLGCDEPYDAKFSCWDFEGEEGICAQVGAIQDPNDDNWYF